MFKIIVFLLIFTSNCFASYTGTFMFTLSGNDNNYSESFLENTINEWFTDNHINYLADISYYTKIDVEDGFITDLAYVTMNNGESGNWYTNDPIKFYAVKGGTEFSFFWVGMKPLDQGEFDNTYLINKSGNLSDISHISFWTNSNILETPEPSTMLLFGLGLLTISFFNRKRIIG